MSLAGIHDLSGRNHPLDSIDCNMWSPQSIEPVPQGDGILDEYASWYPHRTLSPVDPCDALVFTDDEFQALPSSLQDVLFDQGRGLRGARRLARSVALAVADFDPIVIRAALQAGYAKTLKFWPVTNLPYHTLCPAGEGVQSAVQAA